MHDNPSWWYIKFRFSEKVTNIWSYLPLIFDNTVASRWKITPNFCALLRKPELYWAFQLLQFDFMFQSKPGITQCAVSGSEHSFMEKRKF